MLDSVVCFQYDWVDKRLVSGAERAVHVLALFGNTFCIHTLDWIETIFWSFDTNTWMGLKIKKWREKKENLSDTLIWNLQFKQNWTAHWLYVYFVSISITAISK